MPAQFRPLVIRIACFLTFAAAAYFPAKLSRNFSEYLEPWHSAGLAIRHTFGWFAPFYEHIASGAGQSFAFGAFVWLLLWLAPLLRPWLVPATHPLLARIQVWLLAPPYRHQESAVLLVAPLPALWWSLEWELGQAFGRFKGGNPDGSIQFDQIGADVLGIVIFVLINALLLFPLFRQANVQDG